MSQAVVTFELPVGAAADLRRAYADPGRLVAALSDVALDRALALARLLAGAPRARLLLVGRTGYGDDLPVPADELETRGAPGVVRLGGERVLLVPLRVPLLASGRGAARTFGLLAVGPVGDALDGADLALHLSTLLAVDGLARAAEVDPLTGLRTRVAFERALPSLSARLVDESACLVLFDVDGLRALNATRGTRGGDELLATLGAALGEEARGRGEACRYGGDELALVLFGADADEGLAVAARVAQVAAAFDPPAKISAGVACAPGHAETLGGLVFRADQALAHSKASGGGAARAYEPSLPHLPRHDRLAGVFTGDPARDCRNVQGLLESVAAVSRLAPLGETLTAIVDRCVDLTGAERGLLLLAEEAGWSVRVARSAGGSDLPAGPVFAASLADAALAEGRAISRLAEGDAPAISVSAEGLGLTAVLCAPLLGEDVPRGVLYVDAAASVDRFDEATVNFFGALAAATATALRNATLYGRLIDRADRLEADGARVRQLWARDSMARPDGAGYEGLLGESPAMEAVFKQLTAIEGSTAPVVIEGESGTGKELVARAIHERSTRSKGPLVTVNCGAIPEGLFESELFGHVKGSFTGAHTDRVGLVEAADGGTLFLDEVGELAPDAQVKLLRVLERGELRRVGESSERRVDLRVVAATNRKLGVMVAEGTFREDLFYRLAVFELRLPPLRERPRDVAILARHLLGPDGPPLSEGALEILVQAHWPGNVRELRNALDRATVLSGGGPIEAAHVEPARLATAPSAGFGAELFAIPLKDAKVRFAELYARRLTEEIGSIPAAAAKAGVSRQTFYRLLGNRKGQG
jgi:diguanylate cyclase (GGDEF)-like protein